MWARRIVIGISMLIPVTAQVFPATASDGECVELLNPETTVRVNINLDTSEIHTLNVIEYDPYGFYIPPTQRYHVERTAESAVVMDQLTVQSHTIDDMTHMQQWSPDKTRFTYAYVDTDEGTEQDGGSLFIHDAAKGISTRLSAYDASTDIIWSPDSNWLALEHKGSLTDPSVLIYDIGNDTLHSIASTVGKWIPESGVWSPDSTWFTYVQADINRESETYDLVAFNVQTHEQLTYTFESLAVGYEAIVTEAEFTWSPDMTHIALVRIIDVGTERSDVTVLSVPDMDIVARFDSTVSRNRVIWSPSGQRLINSHRDSTDFDLIDLTVEPVAIYPVRTGNHLPYFYWSPDETSLIVYHSHGDLASTMMLVAPNGEILTDDILVPSSMAGFVPWHTWADDHHFILRHFDNGFRALLVFDALTGEYMTLSNPVGYYDISPDGQRVLLRHRNMTALDDAPLQQQLYLWMGEAYIAVNPFDLPEDALSSMWRSHNSELIVLFNDNRVRAYDYLNNTWHDIAIAPALDIEDSIDIEDEAAHWSMRRADCIDELPENLSLSGANHQIVVIGEQSEHIETVRQDGHQAELNWHTQLIDLNNK